MLTGRILTEDGAPLSEVNVSLAETPYNVLVQTNVSGFFTTLGVCAGQQELLVTKAGFVPVRQKANVLTPTTASITLKLEFAGRYCQHSISFDNFSRKKYFLLRVVIYSR